MGFLLTCCLVVIALAGDPVVFHFDGPSTGGELPAPWSFERWWPVVGFGDFRAEASVVDAASAGLTGHGAKVLHVDGADSGLMVGCEGEADVSELRFASWAWKATTLPTGGDFRAKETNDQALQLLFGFEGGKIVGYIWDTTGEVGASGSGMAWREDVRVIVLQSGSARLGSWVHERRDLYADFERLFGEPPPAFGGVAVQSNSQHTESEAAGYVSRITLAAR